MNQKAKSWLKGPKALELFALICAAIPAYYALRLTFNAVFFPMELEVREGVSWLHVLAQSQGISIYDHSQVAFFGSHGPVDHLFKTLVHLMMPDLPSQAVVRTFVALTPFCLFAMTWNASKGLPSLRLPFALLIAVLGYIGMVNLRTYNMLVGRPDPPAICFLALQGALAARIFYRGRASTLQLILHGILVGLGVFTVWRMVPSIASVGLLVALTVATKNRQSWIRLAWTTATGVLLVFLFLLFAAFMGSPGLFYSHFVSFFIDQARVGTHGEWELFPIELTGDSGIRVTVFATMGVVTVLAIFANFRKHWLPVLGLLLTLIGYVLISYGFHQNRGGGGTHYFSPLILFCWLTFLLLINQSPFRGSLRKIFAAALVFTAVVPNWKQITSHIADMEANYEPVLKFRKQLEALDVRGEIMSETYHLYKGKLGDSVVDMGDGFEDMEKKNFFGEPYLTTGRKFYERVFRGQYRYFLTGGIENTNTAAFLKANYNQLGTSPAYSQMNAPGGCLSPINCPILWQKKSP